MSKPLSLDKIKIFSWLNPTYSPIYLKCATLILTYLPTHPSSYLPTCPCTFLPINLLLNPTYMVAPTYLVGNQRDLAIAENNEEKKRALHGAWTCSFKQNLRS